MWEADRIKITHDRLKITHDRVKIQGDPKQL